MKIGTDNVHMDADRIIFKGCTKENMHTNNNFAQFANKKVLIIFHFLFFFLLNLSTYRLFLIY